MSHYFGKLEYSVLVYYRTFLRKVFLKIRKNRVITKNKEKDNKKLEMERSAIP